MKLGLSRLLRLSALLCASSSLTGVALAQQAPIPPEHYEIDAHGVDVIKGRTYLSTPTISIGAPSAGGLSYSRTFSDNYWRDSALGTISSSGSTYYVSIGDATEVFTKSGSTFTSNSADGSALTMSGSNTYSFVSATGQTATFNAAYATSTTNYFGANAALMTSVTDPSGLRIDYNYDAQTICIGGPIGEDPPGGGDCSATQNILRLQSISSNTGYQIHFDFQSNDPSFGLAGWADVTKVTAFNMATDYCSPFAGACTFSRTWPSLTYGDAAGQTTVTDQSGRVSTYGYDSSYPGGPTRARRPGSTADDIALTYSGDKIATATDASGIWNYSYSDSGTTRTTTVTGPLSHQTVYVSDLTTNRLTSVTDALSRARGFLYDGNGRTTRITNPEGDYVTIAYDARGNVTSQTAVAKSGSGLANIATSAAYPASCSNAVICNQPTSTTDALGRVTDYTYDTTHGGVLTATSPAPTSGAVRPQTRYAYSSLYAWYKNAAGTIVQAPSPIYRLTAVSACVASAACAGAAEEVKQTIAYGASGVANNLLPTVTTQGSGDGALSASTTLTYSALGDVLTADGPLAGTADTVRYRYDDARQVVGVTGPDPDGGGALKNRATRTTYDAGGRPTLVEQGTVNSQADGDWAGFAALLSQTATYDAWGRAITQTLVGGGTTQAVQQIAYDGAGRSVCSVTRMNPAAFGSLPASACSLGTQGADGPDRISYVTYDAADQALKVTTGYGTANPRDEAAATYSANGQTATAADGKGNVTTYEYDGFDRLAKTRYPNASGGGSSTSDYEQYGYDAAGNVTQVRRRDGQTIALTYDALNRLTLKDMPSTWPDTSYAYDNLGRQTSASFPGYALAFSYDALDRNVSQASPMGAMTYQYDLAGNRIRITWPDAFYVTYDYNVVGETTAIRENGATSGPGVLASYFYDDAGRRTSMWPGGGGPTSYGYDGASRLSSLSIDPTGTAWDQTYGFGYNAAGQINSRARSNDGYAWSGANVSKAYGVNGLNQMTSAGAATLGHDGRGNLSSDGATTFGYDVENRLTSASTGAALSYDPVGRLYNLTQGATTTLFVYDGSNLVTELDGSGAVLRRYVPGPGVDEPVVWYEGAGTGDRRWLRGDERGSVVATTDSAGNVTTINTYDEYGVPGAGNQGRYQYTGQTFVSELGLYNYKARMYSPTLGRFMQTDAIGYGDGMNWYAYVGNDPVNAIDPSGTECLDIPTRPDLEGGGCYGEDNSAHIPSWFFRRGLGSGGGGGGSGGGKRPEGCPISLGFLAPTPAVAAGLAPPAAGTLSVIAAVVAPLLLSGDTPKPRPQYVIRGGIATSDSLIRGTTQFTYPGRGRISGFSVTTAPNMSVDELARVANYPNGKISYTTVENLYAVGVNVISTPLKPNMPLHGTVLTPAPLSPDQAAIISSTFRVKTNPTKC